MNEDLCKRMINASLCNASRLAHIGGRCPRDPSLRFKRCPEEPGRASTSFDEEELECIFQIQRTLLAGGDARVLVRHAAFARVAQKVASMRIRIREQRAKVGK